MHIKKCEKVRQMEVRLRDFADIVGCDVAAIRSALALSYALPFDDTDYRSTKGPGQVSRRYYSVADAFAWFLAEEIPKAFKIAGRRMSMLVRGAGNIPDYVQGRLASPNQATGRVLIVWSSLDEATEPQAPSGKSEFGYQFSSELGDDDRVTKLRKAHPIVLSVDLDSLFQRFILTAESRGWRIDADGFHKIEAD